MLLLNIWMPQLKLAHKSGSLLCLDRSSDAKKILQVQLKYQWFFQGLLPCMSKIVAVNTLDLRIAWQKFQCITSLTVLYKCCVILGTFDKGNFCLPILWPVSRQVDIYVCCSEFGVKKYLCVLTCVSTGWPVHCHIDDFSCLLIFPQWLSIIRCQCPGKPLCLLKLEGADTVYPPRHIKLLKQWV